MIYSSKQDIVEAILVPLVNLFASRAWVTATESRWTNVGITVRRFLLAALAGQVMARAIAAVKEKLRLEDSMEETLAKLVAADKDP